MSAGIDPGCIRIAATLAGGVVRDVAIVSDRPVSLVSRMTGRRIAEVVAAAEALHGLCGQSHAAAIRLAAAAAEGRAMADDAALATRLAGERVAEHVRSLTLEFPSEGPALEAVRTALSLAQAVARTGTVAEGVAVRLQAALDEAGLGAVEGPARARVDALMAADDASVVAAMAGGAAFLRLPHLPDRAPETGAPARCGCSAADPAAARAARRVEIAEAAAALARPEALPLTFFATSGSLGRGAGYATVETPRGRLFYRLALGPEGTLAGAAVLAPTEWNFHPSGPLARALIGLAVQGDAGETIRLHAAAFDPCVAFEVTVTEAAHA